jgi:hypothetical protein
MRLGLSNKSQSTVRESVEVKVKRGLIPSGITAAALTTIKNKVGITTSPPQQGGGGDGNEAVLWIMSGGSWNDLQVWNDSLYWTE